MENWLLIQQLNLIAIVTGTAGDKIKYRTIIKCYTFIGTYGDMIADNLRFYSGDGTGALPQMAVLELIQQILLNRSKWKC